MAKPQVPHPLYDVVIEHFERRMAALVAEQNRLREAQAAGLVFARVPVKAYTVPARRVAASVQIRLVRIDTARRLKARK